jgi:hypothetical protein
MQYEYGSAIPAFCTRIFQSISRSAAQGDFNLRGQVPSFIRMRALFKICMTFQGKVSLHHV